MQTQRTRDTAPESALRRDLHARGLRYRVSAPLARFGLPRRSADLLFTPARTAVFVDGCFWHGCPTHSPASRMNKDWWRQKLERNQARDRQTNDVLVAAGWAVVRVWEHADTSQAAAAVEQLVRDRRVLEVSQQSGIMLVID